VKTDSVKFTVAPLPADVGGNLGVRFEYTDAKKFFRWSGDLTSGFASFEADFGDGRTTLAAGVSLLPPDAALSEAMFF
jgi:hypothetical protein